MFQAFQQTNTSKVGDRVIISLFFFFIQIEALSLNIETKQNFKQLKPFNFKAS